MRGNDCCCHAAHGMSDEDRRREIQAVNQADYIVGEFLVAVADCWRAGATVTTSIGHDDIEIVFEFSRPRAPAASIECQTVKRNQWWLGSAGSREVQADTVGLADCGRPMDHALGF